MGQILLDKNKHISIMLSSVTKPVLVYIKNCKVNIIRTVTKRYASRNINNSDLLRGENTS